MKLLLHFYTIKIGIFGRLRVHHIYPLVRLLHLFKIPFFLSTMLMRRRNTLSNFELIVHIVAPLGHVLLIRQSLLLRLPLSLSEFLFHIHLHAGSLIFLYIPWNVRMVVIFVHGGRVQGLVGGLGVVHLTNKFIKLYTRRLTILIQFAFYKVITPRMFLSKKTPTFTTKQKSNETNKPKKVLGGWDDDEQEKKQNTNQTPKTKTIPKQENLLQGEDFTNVAPTLPQKIIVKKERQYFNWDQLNDRTDIQCEKKLVEEIVQPGGIRIKPSDSTLNEFAKQIKGMEVHIIASLLLSKIQVNYPFQVKAKALYTMEFLSKKQTNYLDYFKQYVEQIKAFPEPEDNIDNYRKILKTYLNYIGVSSSADTQQAEKPVFTDPGYNDQPKKSSIGNFIQQNTTKPKKAETKKPIIGPGQTKTKPMQMKQQKLKIETNLINIDLLDSMNSGNSPAKDKGSIDLLQVLPSSKPAQMTFDQMLTGPTTEPATKVINLLY